MAKIQWTTSPFFRESYREFVKIEKVDKKAIISVNRKFRLTEIDENNNPDHFPQS